MKCQNARLNALCAINTKVDPDEPAVGVSKLGLALDASHRDVGSRKWRHAKIVW